MKCLPLFPVGSLVLGLLLSQAHAQDDRTAQTVSRPPATALEEGGAPVAAETAEPVESEETLFAQADLNLDGWLSGIEVGPYRGYDADRDGEITELEFMAGRARDRLRIEEGHLTQADIELFAGYDSTFSGYLSGTDISRAGAGAYDLDFDGRVTRDEFFAGRERDRREAAEREARLAEERRRENDRRRAAGEAIEAPTWGKPLVPRKGFMIGWVTSADGEPLPEFTIEVLAYDVGTESLVVKLEGEPQMVGRFKAKDGYYEVRLPDGSFGFVASVILDGPQGPMKYPLRAEGPVESQLDYVEINRSSEGVVKNLVWDHSLDDLP
ncbi:MAG: hypothetical protein R3F07_09400 [Opitutaceae bacterium]